MRNSWTVRVLHRITTVLWFRAYLYRIPRGSRDSGSCTWSSSKPGAKRKKKKKSDRIPDSGLLSLLLSPLTHVPMSDHTGSGATATIGNWIAREIFYFILFFSRGRESVIDVLRVITIRSRSQTQLISNAPGSIIILALLIRRVRRRVLYIIKQVVQDTDSDSDSDSFGIKEQTWHADSNTDIHLSLSDLSWTNPELREHRRFH